jgi:hypothetical protein
MKLKVAIGLVFISLLTGCKAEDSEISDYKGNTEFFKIISEEHYGNIVYDTRTGVEYWCSTGASNVGTLTFLVDKDGKPLIYDRSKEE